MSILISNNIANPSPEVTIVVATYNASMMLGYAIRSVLNSSFSDWELLIIGDHCTDDTESVVARFGDPRIKFHNLATNSGQQATPNNVGVSLARGKYICFLNQDDLFQSHHLQLMMNIMSEQDPDFIIARAVYVEAENVMDGSPLAVINGGFSVQNPQYTPDLFYLASTWFFKRELASCIGPWCLEEELFVTPSQDWLFRVYRSGAEIHFSTVNSIVALPTFFRGSRQGELRRYEHDYVFKRLVANPLDEKEFLDRVVYVDTPRRLMRRIYRATVARVLMFLGIHPSAFEFAIRYGGRGGIVRWWKQHTSPGSQGRSG